MPAVRAIRTVLPIRARLCARAKTNADILLLAKNVDGIYDSDPKVNPQAKKIDKITHMEVINRGLKAMDTTAITMCMDNNIPVLAFALSEKDAIVRAIAAKRRAPSSQTESE